MNFRKRNNCVIKHFNYTQKYFTQSVHYKMPHKRWASLDLPTFTNAFTASQFENPIGVFDGHNEMLK